MNRAEKLTLINRGIDLAEYLNDEYDYTDIDDLTEILSQLKVGIRQDPIHPDTDCVFRIDDKYLLFDEQDVFIIGDIDKATVIPYRDILLIIKATEDKNRIDFWNQLYYYKSTEEFILRDKIKVELQEIE